MTLYNREKLFNLLTCERVREWCRRGWVTSEQENAIFTARFNRYKRPHGLYRTGVFILTTIILACSLGLFGLITGLFDSNDGYKLFLPFAAGLHFFLLYFYIEKKGHFKTGIDDALLYWGLAHLITFIQLTCNTSSEDYFLVFLITTLPVLLFSSIIFIDRTLAVLSYFGLLGLVFFLSLKAGISGKAFLPFSLLFISLFCFFVCTNLGSRSRLLLWHSCLHAVRICCLIVICLSGNYYIVREAGVRLMESAILPGHDIPFAFLFYFLTFAIPLFYLYYGLKVRNYPFLNLGLVFTVLAFITMWYYYGLFPVETLCIAGGLILLIICRFVFDFLKTPKNGITTEKDQAHPELIHAVAESLIIAQTLTPAPVEKQKGGVEFGGGEFGGGGAGSGY